MASNRIDFLYKQEKADPETFLLGRKIEKAEQMNTFSGAATSTTGGGLDNLQRNSVRADQQQAALNGQLSIEEIEAQRINIDMQAKMRDDPLFQIRKREEDDRRELLRNPMKMKRLHEMLNLVSTKKPTGISTASSGRPGATANAADDDSDSLLKQYLKILQQKNEEKARKAAKLLASGKDAKGAKHSGKKSRRSRSRSVSSKSSSRSSRSSSSSSSTNSLLEGYMNALKEKQSLANKLKAEEEMQEKLEKKAQERKDRERLHPGGGPDDDEEGKDGNGSDASPPSRRRARPQNKNQKPTGRNEWKAQPPYQQHHQQQGGKSKYDNSSNRQRQPDSRRQDEEPYYRRDEASSRRPDKYARPPRRDSDDDERRDRQGRGNRDRRRSRSRSRSQTRKYRRNSPSPSSSARRSRRSRSRSPRSHSRSPPPQRSDNKKGRKMSPGTMEKRRREMAMAAEERDVERVSNVKRYEEEERKEKNEEEELRKGAKSSFLQGVMVDHAERSSVGDRVQRNKFNVQRRGNDTVSGSEKFLKR